MREAGMSISTEPMLLSSQIIDPPVIRFQNLRHPQDVFVSDCAPSCFVIILTVAVHLIETFSRGMECQRQTILAPRERLEDMVSCQL